MLTVNQANKIREIANNDDKLMETLMMFETLTPEQQDLILARMREMIRSKLNL
ncbi:MAG: hypothetical protein IKW88_00960 [Clostridiales bacterium]|nr:hypothetical protein [Clostridiales bacterium]